MTVCFTGLYFVQPIEVMVKDTDLSYNLSTHLLNACTETELRVKSLICALVTYYIRKFCF